MDGLEERIAAAIHRVMFERVYASSTGERPPWIDAAARVVLEELNPSLVTFDDLIALPVGSIINAAREGAIEQFCDGHWYVPGRRDRLPVQRLIAALPARLLWHPSWVVV